MKYNQQLMEEYEKYQLQQEKTGAQQEHWQVEMRNFEVATQRSLTDMQNIAETRLNSKTSEITRVRIFLGVQSKIFVTNDFRQMV